MHARSRNETKILPLYETFLHITIAIRGDTSFAEIGTHFLPIFYINNISKAERPLNRCSFRIAS